MCVLGRAFLGIASLFIEFLCIVNAILSKCFNVKKTIKKLIFFLKMKELVLIDIHTF